MQVTLAVVEIFLRALPTQGQAYSAAACTFCSAGITVNSNSTAVTAPSFVYPAHTEALYLRHSRGKQATGQDSSIGNGRKEEAPVP